MTEANDDSKVWQQLRRIGTWLRANYDENSTSNLLFNRPANEEDVVFLENQIGLKLPRQLSSLLRYCNGFRQGYYPMPMKETDPTKWRILSTIEIFELWQMLCSIDAQVEFSHDIKVMGHVQPVWWTSKWLPIADCGMGDVICVDMEPAAGGEIGQLIQYMHDFAQRRVVYSSILEWLHESAEDLESDLYVYEPGVGLMNNGLPR